MRLYPRLLSLIPLAVFLLAPLAVQADEAKSGRTFLAGAAASNISPPLGEPLIGGWRPTPATNIHDELHARCLVLDDGSNKVAFVICDSLGIKRDVCDAARELICEETDFKPNHILIAATHTHSATPATSDAYREFLVRRIADGVRRAMANRQEARIGWGGVDEPSAVFNRRWHTTDPNLRKNPFGGIDEVRMNPPRNHPTLVRPAGPIDPEVSFLSVQTTDGKPIALLANYSLHYVGGVRSGEVSADYFAVFAEHIGELMDADGQDPPFVGILSNGTSGDINNINFQAKSPRRERYEQMERVGRLIAERVYEAHQSIEFKDWVPLAAASRELTLKYRKPDQEMQDWFAKVRARPEGEEPYHSRERIYADRVQSLLEGPDSSEKMLQVIKVGELGIAAIPFETFVETGLELKAKSPFEDFFTIELANGWDGYLPTPEQHELGGYETWMGTNKVQKDASDLIEKTLFELMDELQSK